MVFHVWQAIIHIRGSVPFPSQKAINIQSFSEYNQTQSYTDHVEFQSWMSRQTELQEHIKKVCEEYGKSLRRDVPLKQFMYDPEHKLLFCRNAKVNSWCVQYININKLSGWNDNVEETLSRTDQQEKSNEEKVWTNICPWSF